MSRTSVAAGLLVTLLVAPAVLGQADEALLARQLQAAQELEKGGQEAQARKLYQQVAEAEPPGASTDDALLALARLDWPVIDPARLGQVPVTADQLQQARERLEQLLQRFPASDSAAEAQWRLALLLDEPRAPFWSAAESAALLRTLPVLHPDTSWAPAALSRAAELHLELGRPEQAQELSFALLSRWPEHETAPQAWLVLGMADAQLGRFSEALFALGRARAAAEPGAEVGERALRLATLVDRVAHGRSGRAVVRSRQVPGRLADLAAAPGGAIAAVVEREGQILELDREATNPRALVPNAESVAIDRWQRLWVARGRSGLTAPDGTGLFAAAQDNAEIVDIVPVGAREAWLIDARGDRAVRVDAAGSTLATAELARAEPVAAVAGPDGGLVLLDARDEQLLRLDREGRVIDRIGLGERLRSPADLETDPLGQLYVLGGKESVVLVLGPDGTLRERIQLPSEGELAIDKPTELAVDEAGQVVVYDQRHRRVTWLR